MGLQLDQREQNGGVYMGMALILCMSTAQRWDKIMRGGTRDLRKYIPNRKQMKEKKVI